MGSWGSGSWGSGSWGTGGGGGGSGKFSSFPFSPQVSSMLITYRSLGPNNDPLWGQGQQNFLTNLNAVTQAILTRLQLLQNEWWASVLDGIPYFQNILGKAPNTQQIDTLLTQRILGTPFVTGLASLNSSYNHTTLTFFFSATVVTQFGNIVVSNFPTPSIGALP